MSENKKHGCGCHDHHHDENCSCQHDHHHEDCNHEDCDCGCEESVVMLQDADGNEVAFHLVYDLEHEGKQYVYLQSAEDDDDVIEIFEVNTVEEDGQFYDLLDPVDDDLYDVLYEKLLLAASEDACEDDDDEDDVEDEDDEDDDEAKPEVHQVGHFDYDDEDIFGDDDEDDEDDDEEEDDDDDEDDD